MMKPLLTGISVLLFVFPVFSQQAELPANQPQIYIGARLLVTLTPPRDLQPISEDRTAIRTINEKQLIGEVVRWNADSLILENVQIPETRGKLTVTFPVEVIEKLEISTAKKSNIGKGALFGFIVGGAIGGLLLGSTASGSTEREISENAGSWAAIGALGGGTLGAVIGMGIGAAQKSDQWEIIHLHDQDELRGAAKDD